MTDEERAKKVVREVFLYDPKGLSDISTGETNLAA
jgi:hypothetical protein